MFSHDGHDLDRISLDAALRIARQRGLAERSRVIREITRRAVSSVRGLFSVPRGREAECLTC